MFTLPFTTKTDNIFGSKMYKTHHHTFWNSIFSHCLSSFQVKIDGSRMNSSKFNTLIGDLLVDSNASLVSSSCIKLLLAASNQISSLLNNFTFDYTFKVMFLKKWEKKLTDQVMVGMLTKLNSFFQNLFNMTEKYSLRIKHSFTVCS